MQDDVELSVVVPAKDEVDSLPELVGRLVAVLPEIVDTHEIIVVDDGSTDGTAAVLDRLVAEHERLRVVRLSRSFGHQAALLAGLSRAEGRAVVTMDADLQHPPEVIADLVEQWRSGHDVVHTIRRDTVESAGPLKRLTSRLFYRLVRTGGQVALEPGMADFRLATRQVVAEVLRTAPRRPFLRGAFLWVGFRQTTVPYVASPRFAGSASYTWRHMFRLAVDGLVSYGEPPVHWPVVAGVMTSLAAFGVGGYAILVALVTDRAVPGWASIVVVLAFLFGLLFLLLGVTGTYLVALHHESLDLPPYVVADETGTGAVRTEVDGPS